MCRVFLRRETNQKLVDALVILHNNTLCNDIAQLKKLILPVLKEAGVEAIPDLDYEQKTWFPEHQKVVDIDPNLENYTNNLIESLKTIQKKEDFDFLKETFKTKNELIEQYKKSASIQRHRAEKAELEIEILKKELERVNEIRMNLTNHFVSQCGNVF